MKKVIAIILCLVCILSLASCVAGDKGTGSEDGERAVSNSASSFTVRTTRLDSWSIPTSTMPQRYSAMLRSSGHLVLSAPKPSSLTLKT